MSELDGDCEFTYLCLIKLSHHTPWWTSHGIFWVIPTFNLNGLPAASAVEISQPARGGQSSKLKAVVSSE